MNNGENNIAAPADAEVQAVLSAFRAGDWEAAERLARRLCAVYPASPFAWKALGATLGQLGKSAEAFEAMRQAVHTGPQDVEAWANLGVLAQGLGRIDAAIECGERVVALDGANAAAHNRLGTLYRLGGALEKADASYGRAIELQPDLAEAHFNRGVMRAVQGSWPEAEACYLAALECNPRYSEALNNLGNLYRATGRPAAAETHYRRALQANPLFAVAQCNLGIVLKENGRTAEAEACYREALRLAPDFAEALSNLGNLLRERGCFDEAIAHLRRAVEINPDFAEAHNNLGSALKDAWRLDEAAESCRRAIALVPAYAEAHNNLGNVWRETGDLSSAAACYRQAIACNANLVEAYCNLGGVLRELGIQDEAAALLRQALVIAPGNMEALEGLGRLLIDSGDFAGAKKIIDEALALDPANPAIWAQIPALRRMGAQDADWLARARDIVAACGAETQRKVTLLFAMGKYCDDVGDYAAAFDYFSQANAIRKRQYGRYDRENLSRLVDTLIAAYTPAALAALRPWGNPSQRPLFIVGMPRSGTSLIEQILSSHPEIFGAGELNYWNEAMMENPSAVVTARLTQDMLERAAAGCLENLARLDADALRVVDKMPGNYGRLGFIHAAFPQARILHLHRNPVDTCLSIYFQNFSSGHPYANDLDDLAHYYREYSRLMQRWRDVLPADTLLDVSYEAMVEDTEAWSRRIIGFVGLEWSESCLEFHKTERRVGTASNWQVRQPIYKTSKERWRNYAQYVGPLLPLLDLECFRRP